jgi:hypothetical protein
MNMRLFTVLLAVSALGLASCTSDDTGDDGAGGGGGDGTGGGGNVGNEGGTGVGGGTGGTGGDTGCDLGTDGCVGCGELITFVECSLDQLCTDSEPILQALSDCTCMTCATDCGDNACADPPMDPTAECQACAMAMCGTEAAACANDVSD